MNTQVTWKELDVIDSIGNIPESVTGLTQDSRLIELGFIFMARSGKRVNGLDFVQTAVDKGASVIITADPLPDDLPLPAIQVSDFHQALVTLSHAVYGDPSRKLKIIGITGTKGKSSCAYLIRSILSSAGKKCGLIGTIEYDTGSRKMDAPLTTPQIDRLCELWAEMVDSGCEYCVMEVSSIALDQGRVDGTRFEVGAFTNMSHEHLDYHETMDDYSEAKSLLFKMLPKEGLAVINGGDPYGQYMIESSAAELVITFGNREDWTDITVTTIEQGFNGGRFKLDTPPIAVGGTNRFGMEITTPLIGTFHGQNIALAGAVAFGLRLDPVVLIAGVMNLKAVPGRMESVSYGQPFAVIVDFAHAPDPLEKALKSLRPICAGNLIVVFGCGGDRDRTKRPIMGKIAAENADKVIVTSDNSRSEDASSIIRMIIDGVPSNLLQKISSEVDRHKAIEIGIREASAGDILIIAGKGHEKYQEEHGVRHHFDDCEVAGDFLTSLGWKPEESR